MALSLKIEYDVVRICLGELPGMMQVGMHLPCQRSCAAWQWKYLAALRKFRFLHVQSTALFDRMLQKG